MLVNIVLTNPVYNECLETLKNEGEITMKFLEVLSKLGGSVKNLISSNKPDLTATAAESALEKQTEIAALQAKVDQVKEFGGMKIFSHALKVQQNKAEEQYQQAIPKHRGASVTVTATAKAVEHENPAPAYEGFKL